MGPLTREGVHSAVWTPVEGPVDIDDDHRVELLGITQNRELAREGGGDVYLCIEKKNTYLIKDCQNYAVKVLH